MKEETLQGSEELYIDEQGNLRDSDGKIIAPAGKYIPPPFYKRIWWSLLYFYNTITGIYLVNKIIEHTDNNYTHYYMRLDGNGSISWTTDPRQASAGRIIGCYMWLWILNREKHLKNINYSLVSYQDAYFMYDIFNSKN